MSDAWHDATHRRRRADVAETDNQPDTAQPKRKLGAAPWERFAAPTQNNGAHRWQADPPADQPAPAQVRPAGRPTGEDEADAETAGCHSDGVVSVADLIAKVGARVTDHPIHHHQADEQAHDPAEDHQADQQAARPVPNALQDTLVIDTPAYSFGYSLDAVPELPDQEATDYPHGDDEAELDDIEADPIDSDPADKATTGRRQIRPRRGRAKPAAGTPRKKTKSRLRVIVVAGRSVAALSAVLALVLTGGAWKWSNSKNDHLNTVSALDPNSQDIVDPNGQIGDENFLIVGMDSRSGDNANMGAGDTDDADGARSDTVMLVNIPANRKRVVVISFPRDLAITPLQCEAWNPDTHKYGPIYDQKKGAFGPKIVYTETKLNSTFAFGGPKCLVKEIQKLSGLSINRFIAVDFSGFAKMVDALGGVEVCSKTALQDYELGTVLEHSGRQVVDGSTALNYVRARQVTTESNGDYGRIKRQQLFVSSLLRALISENTLVNLNKLNNVVNLFISNSYVDGVQTKDMVQLGRSLQGMAAGHITFVTVPTGVTDQNGDEPPRTADMKALFAAIINDDPLPLENDHNAESLGSSPTDGPTNGPGNGLTGGQTQTTKKSPQPTQPNQVRREQVVTTSPQEITVQVSNATGQSGLATTATTQLKRNGFNVMTPDDYPKSVNTTTVLFSPGNEQAAATVAAAFANSKIERATGIGNVIQVVLGPDFSSVATPPPSGTSISMTVDRNTTSTPTKLPEDLTVTNAADTTCE